MGLIGLMGPIGLMRALKMLTAAVEMNKNEK
jgi:hypothetical protein